MDNSSARLEVQQQRPQERQRGLPVAVHEALWPQLTGAQRGGIYGAAQRAQRALHVLRLQRAPLGREMPGLDQALLA